MLQHCPTSRIYHSGIFQRFFALGFNMGITKFGGGTITFLLVTCLTSNGKITHSVTTPSILWDDMFNLQPNVFSTAISTFVAPLFQQVFAYFVTVHCTL